MHCDGVKYGMTQSRGHLYQLGLSSFLAVVDVRRVLAAAGQQLAAKRTRYAARIALRLYAPGTVVARKGCPDRNEDIDL